MILPEKEMILLLQQLISTKTENPPGNEFLTVKIAEKFFKKNKIKFKKFNKTPNRENIIAQIGKGHPIIHLAFHSDVVPAGKGWKTNPFKAIIKNGKIYGRGTVDDKGPLAAGLIVLKELKKNEKELNGTISLGIFADEEKGSEFGLKFAFKQKKIKADYAIVPDIGSELKTIDIGEKGALFLKITAKGKQAHGSRPQNGINAINAINEYLNELKKYKLKIPKKKTIFSKPTINIGVINGGTTANTVAGECFTEIDFRFSPGQNWNEILKDMKTIGKKIEKKTKAKISFKILQHNNAYQIDKNNKLVKIFSKHTKKITGKTPKTTGQEGTTLAKEFANHKIPAIAVGPGGDVAHSANEFISISQLEKFRKILLLTLKELVK